MVVSKFIGIIIGTNQQGLAREDFQSRFLRRNSRRFTHYSSFVSRGRLELNSFTNKNIDSFISKATTRMEIAKHRKNKCARVKEFCH
jgi:hypothetical protein